MRTVGVLCVAKEMACSIYTVIETAAKKARISFLLFVFSFVFVFFKVVSLWVDLLKSFLE